MAEPSITLDTLIDHVRAESGPAPALDRLGYAIRVAARISELGEHLIGFYVDEARQDGASWADIGARLGVSRQAVQKRFIATGERTGGQPGFWDRTTAELRDTVRLAREEARRRRKTYLGTEHLLLALAARDEDPAGLALAACGAPPATVRAAIDGRVGVPAGDPLPDETPFTRLSLTTLQHSSREALRDGSRTVDTGHLALALLTVGDGLAHDVMINLGVGYDALREALADRTKP